MTNVINHPRAFEAAIHREARQAQHVVENEGEYPPMYVTFCNDFLTSRQTRAVLGEGR